MTRKKATIVTWTAAVLLGLFLARPGTAPAYQSPYALVDKTVSTDAGTGQAVALAGTRLAFSAPGENNGRGAVYLCQTSSLGMWDLDRRLAAPDGGQNDYFGFALALGDDYLAVGAPGNDAAGTDAGAVYLFGRVSGSWQLRQKLVPAAATANAAFGFSLATAGNLLAVGAPGTNGSGTVYIYRRAAESGNWEPLTAVQGEAAFSIETPDYFGAAVAVDDEHLLVGAPGSDGGAKVDGGAAYLFSHHRDDDNWVQQAVFHAEDHRAYGFFGTAVAVAGSTALVGCTTDDGNTGAVYIFQENGAGGSWTQRQKITPGNGRRNDRFATAIAMNDNFAVVGAPGQDGQASSSGAVYILEQTGGSWQEKFCRRPHHEENLAFFGQAVAIDPGNNLATGAPGQGEGRGAVYQENAANGGFQFLMTVLEAGEYFDLTVDTGIDPAMPPAQTWFFFTWTSRGQNYGIYLLQSDPLAAVPLGAVTDYAAVQYDFLHHGETIISFRLADLGLASGDNLTYAYAYSPGDISQAVCNSIVTCFVK